MANTNVKFLRGTHENLLKLTSTNIQEGTFYLTTDTDRLFIGKNSEIVELNKSITKVTNLNSLPTINVEDGQFYYVEDGNILCIYQKGAWTQINPNTDTKITEFKTEIGTTLNTDNSVDISHKITTDEKDTDGNFIGYNTGLTIEGGSNVSIIADIENQKITISATDTDNSVTNETLDIIPLKGSTEETASEDDKKTGYNITVTDSNGKPVYDFLNPEIIYGKDGSETEYFRNNTLALDVYTIDEVNSLLKVADALVFKGLIANFEGIEEIKQKEKQNKNGDTYKIQNDIIDTTDSENPIILYKTGDLLIAKGIEDDEGYLNEFEWVHIPSGDEIYTGGDKISISSGGTISHDKITHTTSSSNVATTNFISGVTIDDWGHITGYTTSSVDFPEDKDTTITDAKLIISDDNNEGKEIKLEVQLTDSSGNSINNTTKTSITTDTLLINSTEETNFSIDLVWGSFDSVS